MKWRDEDLPSLRMLEQTIVQFWATHPAMNDYTVGRAYDAAYQQYRARSRGREPKPTALSGVDLEAFDAVRNVCEQLLSEGAEPVKGTPSGITDPLTLEKLLEYLRELVRSVERHTKLGGRCGYLEFVQSFIP